MNSNFMCKMQRETEEYILYSPDSLNYITDNMYDILEKSINFYKELFSVDYFRKIQINCFDSIDDFRKYIYELRGEMLSLPSYAKGTFDKGMINAFIETDLEIDSIMYNKRLYMASHELFHIMYMELIWEKEGKSRIVWFDEGMAQLFSGEYDKDLSCENFYVWFENLIEMTKEIPNLNDLNHNGNFETDRYSGYKLSLLAVKYLYEILGYDKFKELMYNTDDIIEYGNDIVEEAINYYSLGLRFVKK